MEAGLTRVARTLIAVALLAVLSAVAAASAQAAD